MVLLLAVTLGVQQPTTPATATAELSGKVVGRDGSSLPGVVVTLDPAALTVVEGRSNVVGGFTTGTSGAFRLSGIVPGTYSVKFELNGFTTYTRARLALAAGQKVEMTVALDLDWRRATDPENPPLRAVPSRPIVEPTFALSAGEVAVGVETSLGTFYIAVDTKRAPITATNFLKYVDAKLYDYGRFHRATRADNYVPSLPNRPMMNIIQGGIDPTRRDKGFPAIPLERTSVTGIKHVTGVVSMARGTGADTATSDFFVLLDDQPSLDFGGLRFDDGQGGAAFGHVLSGLDVVRKIQQQPVDGQNLAAPVTIRGAWRVGSPK
jgi:peptidyl-prolyl cis-trans isomerase A (cyclophilin A)